MLLPKPQPSCLCSHPAPMSGRSTRGNRAYSRRWPNMHSHYCWQCFSQYLISPPACSQIHLRLFVASDGYSVCMLLFYFFFIYHLLTGLPTQLKVLLQMWGPGNNIQSILKQSTAALHIYTITHNLFSVIVR